MSKKDDVDNQSVVRRIGWGGRIRTSAVQGSKPCALPLGDTPIHLFVSIADCRYSGVVIRNKPQQAAHKAYTKPSVCYAQFFMQRGSIDTLGNKTGKLQG